MNGNKIKKQDKDKFQAQGKGNRSQEGRRRSGAKKEICPCTHQRGKSGTDEGKVNRPLEIPREPAG
ncbi:MAG TPA: hypothetical protein VMJ90_10995 [Anaerolineales bacterium]|nr:hypothetical protein [Anaerolineales bacterium]